MMHKIRGDGIRVMILDSKALLLEPQTHVFTGIEDEPGATCGGVIREFACTRAAPPGAMARERRVGHVGK